MRVVYETPIILEEATATCTAKESVENDVITMMNKEGFEYKTMMFKSSPNEHEVVVVYVFHRKTLYVPD